MQEHDKRDNVVAQKSKKLAVRGIRLYQYFVREKQESVMAKQILRSATSIGANVREAMQGQSKRDFTAKMSIALKEAAETQYWLELLYETEYLERKEYESIQEDCTEVAKLLTAIVKKSKEQ